MSPDLPDDMADSIGDYSNTAKSPASSLPTLGAQLSTSATDESSGIHGLPSEVLIKIAQSFQDKHKVSTLRSLCMVSKQMDSVARKQLYHTITVDSYTGLSSLCRTIKENVALRLYIQELELLIPGQVEHPDYLDIIDDTDFAMQCSLYLDILKRTTNLRRLNIVLLHLKGSSRPLDTCLTPQTYDLFISKLSGAITQSQRQGSATVILPLLEEVRLGTDRFRLLGLAQPLVLVPFLDLPSMSRVEGINDSGVWPGRSYPSLRNATRASAIASGTHQYRQIKSMVLKDTHCIPTDIMDVCNIFPAMELFFCQHVFGKLIYKFADDRRIITNQRTAAPSEKRYLTYSFGKLQKLQTLALAPIISDPIGPDWSGMFTGPSGFLSLTGLGALTSLATVISLFAPSDGPATGRLTPSPMEVLPCRLRSLQIIVDHWTYRSLAPFRTPLNENWFQPREAALGFLSTLASVCTREFPALRHMEYIWAVDRTSDARQSSKLHRVSQDDVLNRRMERPCGLQGPHTRWVCDGSRPLCCDPHARIQALSPDEDYTSRAEGIISPFKDRFDALGAAFHEANVVFRIVELKEYSDFYSHWQGGRE